MIEINKMFNQMNSTFFHKTEKFQVYVSEFKSTLSDTLPE
jgi:hypothetical protein